MCTYTSLEAAGSHRLAAALLTAMNQARVASFSGRRARAPSEGGTSEEMQTTSKDLAIDLGQDRPGQLAKATEAIAKANINIDGYCDSGDGILHVVTSDPAAARRAVEGAGFKVRAERDVVVADAEDRPGTAARIFRQIADAGVNVDISYSLASGRVVVGSKDFAKLKEALHAERPAAARM